MGFSWVMREVPFWVPLLGLHMVVFFLCPFNVI